MTIAPRSAIAQQIIRRYAIFHAFRFFHLALAGRAAPTSRSNPVPTVILLGEVNGVRHAPLAVFRHCLPFFSGGQEAATSPRSAALRGLCAQPSRRNSMK